MRVRRFFPEDVPEIYRVVQSRGTPQYNDWVPQPPFDIYVAADEFGLAGVLLMQPSRGDSAFVDVFEVEYEGDRPTLRGARAWRLLWEWTQANVLAAGRDVFGMVLVENERHRARLHKLGWRTFATIEVAPRGSCANSERTDAKEARG